MSNNIRIAYILVICLIGTRASVFGDTSFPYYKEYRNNVVSISTYDSNNKLVSVGSGFIFEVFGDVITNMHVVEKANSIKVKTNSNVVLDVSALSAHDVSSDLVRLTVDVPKNKKTKLKPLKINYNLPDVGDKIYIIGNPLGLESSLSEGIVSNIIDFPNYGKVIQLTAPISKGSSGSPVFNKKGELVGIATFQSVEGQNVNFALPSARLFNLKKAMSVKPADYKYTSKISIGRNSKNYGLDEGFRALKWGAGIDEAKSIYKSIYKIKGRSGKNFEEKETDKLRVTYRIFLEDAIFSGVCWGDISYDFYNDSFYGVYMFLDYYDNDSIVPDFMEVYSNASGKFGRPENDSVKYGDYDPKEFRLVRWNKNGVSISLTKVNDGNKTQLSLTVYNEQARSKKSGF